MDKSSINFLVRLGNTPLLLLQMDIFQFLRPGEHQQIRQHAEQRPAESGIGHIQRLHHGAHGAVQNKNLVF